MTETDPTAIIAQVTDAENPAVRLGAGFLASNLRSVSKAATPPSFSLTFAPAGIDANQLPPAQIYVLSIRSELELPRAPLDAVMTRWTDRIQTLQRHGAPIFVCTVFRSARDGGSPGSPSEILAHIRMLNLAVVKLSHSLGIRVIDIDRVLAHFGERVVRADHSLNHPRAADAAGHAIARTILASSLDRLFDPLDQENALIALGDMNSLPRLLREREEHRLEQAADNG